MSNKNSKPIAELLDAISANLSDIEILSALVQSDISLSITSERIQRGMTQAEFAEFMGVQQSQVSKWENGDYNFTIKKLAEIATKLDLSLSCKLVKRHPIRKNYSRCDNVIEFSHYSQNNAADWCTSGYIPKDIDVELEREM